MVVLSTFSSLLFPVIPSLRTTSFAIGRLSAAIIPLTRLKSNRFSRRSDVPPGVLGTASGLLSTLDKLTELVEQHRGIVRSR